MEAVLTREASFPRRLSAYLAERFPVLGHGVLIAAYYSSNQFLARTLISRVVPRQDARLEMSGDRSSDQADRAR